MGGQFIVHSTPSSFVEDVRVLSGYFSFSDTYIYLVGVWLGGDQRTNTIKTWFKEIGLRLKILSTTPLSIVNTIGRTDVFR